MYPEGLGCRVVGRILGFSNVAILNWIRFFGEIAKNKIKKSTSAFFRH
ncbi:MAG: hypothetical protein P857_710 [Candidatus Xenolissoclinum pacificiensis L6]|uniref:Transposase n=1 Tax=Candidatus Xenolissoclinum pacificiensis L6 TaxID=1401685 RepID=W2UZ54_9RICK|nr:MAG: hypothetical protein P857_710 [Candidatus Xenolissoclinum pacificiensis L6]